MADVVANAKEKMIQITLRLRTNGIAKGGKITETRVGGRLA
jgi:hypothetical protein